VTDRDQPGAAVTAVLGLGNVLMGDDALGPWVVAHLLARWEFPPEVEVLDLGTPGLDLHPFVAGRDRVILVDVVRSDGPPGQLKLYPKEDLLRHAPGPRVSPHDPGVKEVLLTLDFAGSAPSEVLLVGVVPDSVAAGTGLSAPVKAAAALAEQAVLDELARLGHAVRRREPAAAPDLWWEAAADG
jgi:hydrogenase maturation protease